MCDIAAVTAPPGGVRGRTSYAILTTDGTEARLLRADSGEPFGPPFQHPSPVRIGLIDRDARDGRTVLLVGEDGVARLYDGTTGEPAGPAFRHPGTAVQAATVPGTPHFLTAAGEEVLAW